MPLKLCSCEPNELTPEFEIETEPNMLVRTMSSAQAAIGNANASNARTTTRLMLIPSQIFLLFRSCATTRTSARDIGRLWYIEHLWFHNDKSSIHVRYQQLNNSYDLY